MKQLSSWLLKHALSAFAFLSFLVLFWLGLAYAALSWPSSTPSGETTGGKFATVLNRMLVSGNYATDTTGKVRLSAATDQIGTVSDGKWCRAESGKISCTDDAPTGTTTSGAVPLVSAFLERYDGRTIKLFCDPSNTTGVSGSITIRKTGISGSNTSWYTGTTQRTALWATVANFSATGTVSVTARFSLVANPTTKVITTTALNAMGIKLNDFTAPFIYWAIPAYQCSPSLEITSDEMESGITQKTCVFRNNCGAVDPGY